MITHNCLSFASYVIVDKRAATRRHISMLLSSRMKEKAFITKAEFWDSNFIWALGNYYYQAQQTWSATKTWKCYFESTKRWCMKGHEIWHKSHYSEVQVIWKLGKGIKYKYLTVVWAMSWERCSDGTRTVSVSLCCWAPHEALSNYRCWNARTLTHDDF